jgi:peroxiredoxin family protein
MAETVIMCSGAHSFSSVGTSLTVAIQLKGAGQDVAVFLDWEALVAVVDKKLEPAPILAPYAATMVKNAKKAGFPEDPMDFLKGAKAAGVPIYSCAMTVGLLGIAAKLPPEIQPLEFPGEVVKLFAEAKKVIGGF